MKFESPIEEMFYDALAPLLASGVEVKTQVPVLNYRVDFLIRGPRRVVIECDGREFHDFNRDRIRDIAMLDSGLIDDVLRFRGCDIVFAGDECAARAVSYFPFLAKRDANPLTEEEKMLCGMCMRNGNIKPIWRTLCNSRMNDNDETCDLLGRAKDGRIGYQLKTAYWNWTYTGSRIMPLDQWIQFQVAKAKKSGRAHRDLSLWTAALAREALAAGYAGSTPTCEGATA